MSITIGTWEGSKDGLHIESNSGMITMNLPGEADQDEVTSAIRDAHSFVIILNTILARMRGADNIDKLVDMLGFNTEDGSVKA